MQLEVKTILNRIQHFSGFVYQEVRLRCRWRRLRIEIRIEPHQSMGGKCSQCRQPAPGYDRLPERSWLFVPLWGIKTYFLYAARRVECTEHGVVVEHIPWSEGKRPITLAMMGFLARWARRLSWRETARAFQTSWEAVYRSVEWFVQWGLAHRKLEGVRSIGVDEIHWAKGKRADNFLTAENVPLDQFVFLADGTECRPTSSDRRWRGALSVESVRIAAPHRAEKYGGSSLKRPWWPHHGDNE